jgi:5,10-methylenetetrahydromethanopterin reductase
MTTASAIATLEGLAPGRLACGFGTGATARLALNKRNLSWATTRRYVEQVHALLRGEIVEIDGEHCQMIHHPRWAAARPFETPLILSAMGSKGSEIAIELNKAGVIAGIMSMEDIDAPISWRIRTVTGTVLDDGESIGDERVKQALGPWYVMGYHFAWQMAPASVSMMPLGEQWQARIESERPDGQRHLSVHEGHATDVMPRDQEVLDAAGEALGTVGWVGTRDEIRELAMASGATGTSEILYLPSGDIKREMRAFASAVFA